MTWDSTNIFILLKNDFRTELNSSLMFALIIYSLVCPLHLLSTWLGKTCVLPVFPVSFQSFQCLPVLPVSFQWPESFPSFQCLASKPLWTTFSPGRMGETLRSLMLQMQLWIQNFSIVNFIDQDYYPSAFLPKPGDWFIINLLFHYKRNAILMLLGFCVCSSDSYIIVV